MEKITWKRANLTVTRMGFGCLPIQRLETGDAARLVRMAYDAGVTFFDTARAYSDSEHKVSLALGDVRDRVVLATKTAAKTADAFWKDLDTSLRTLNTSYIDVYQFHNPGFVPLPGGEDGLYDAALKARAEGKIRFIGITQHSLERANEAVDSGLYDTLQYPFNHLATEGDIALVQKCGAAGMGFIAMKGLSGGLITDATLPFSFLRTYPHVVPIWGIQRESELAQFLALEKEPPVWDDALRTRIEEDRHALSGSFCRGCGYCLPCPANIPIDTANRITQLLQRSPTAQWLTPEWKERMERVEDCVHCGVCATRCPYGLKPFDTLPGHLSYYRELYAQQK